MHRYRHKYTFPSIIILLILAFSGLVWGYFNMKQNTTVPRGSNMSVLGIELDQTRKERYFICLFAFNARKVVF